MVTRRTTAKVASDSVDLSILNESALEKLQAQIQDEISRRKVSKEDEEQEKARKVNLRLTEIRKQLQTLENEIETLIDSVDSDIVYVGFSYSFGDAGDASYNNSDKHWSSSSY